MDLREQRLLLAWWDDYNGDAPATTERLHDFYFDVVRGSCLYKYGIVFEVFDVVVNGMFDPRKEPEPTPLAAPRVAA